MRSIKRIVVVVMMLANGYFFQGCTAENDEGLAQVSVEMRADSDQSTFRSGRVENTDLVFSEVLLGVTELEFETPEESELEDNNTEDGNIDTDLEEEGEEEVEFEGRFVVDLINGTSTPDFGISSIVPGVYEEIEIEMEPILENGYSLYVAFEFTNANNEVVPAEYGYSGDLEFELEKEGGYVLEAGAIQQILVLLHLDALFTGVDLNTAVADNDGVVRINSTSNADLAATLASNLGHIMEAGEDEDRDGQFDD